MSNKLIADLILPEIQNQLDSDESLWPNVKALYAVSVTKKRKSAATWYILLQGNEIQPVISSNKEKVRAATKKKVKTVKIQIEDQDLLNFITGGLSGVKAYMTGKIKVRGDLILAQKLEEVFEKAGGRERALDFIKNNEELLSNARRSTSKL